MTTKQENPAMTAPHAIYVISLGCAKNLVDTEVMCGTLLTAGFCIAEDERDANIVLVNTCGFIRDARKEAEESLAWAVAWKGRSRKKFIVAAGCLAQRDPVGLRRQFPSLDLIIGLDDVPRLAELLQQMLEQNSRPASPEMFPLPTYLYTEKTPRILLTPRTFGYIKVAEGCDHRCAYCAIPHIRGNQRSRTLDSVLAECHQLLDQGIREINLIAQDTSRYGADLPQPQNLENLLRACDAIPGDFWLRVLYTHPLHITEGLLEIMAHGQHVVPYLDIPLQHISTPILQRMARGMDGAKTRILLENIRKKYPSMTIRTTFLVGFPGETEENFQELLSFIQDFGFDRLGAFAFSPEEGTPAAAMDNTVRNSLAESRRKQLLAAQQKISLARNRALVGTIQTVLLEEQIASGKWTGRTMGDAPEVDQSVTVRTRKGRQDAGFARVRITNAGEYHLQGEEIPNDIP